MNRYRTIPSLGQPKASATTTCQKCLKKDEYCGLARGHGNADFSLRHYSYECKSTATERPYVSRPSRSQQFINPKLKPKLTSETENGLMQSKGVADAELARTQAAREVADNKTMDRRSQSPQPSRHKRSISVSSRDSVSTISTSRSRSPPSRRMNPNGSDRGRERRSRSRSHSADANQKRKYRDLSYSRSPPRVDSARKSRRYGSGSPGDRGRPKNDRRGSNRSRSRDDSLDRSEVTKQRRSLDEVDDRGHRYDREPPRQYNQRKAPPPPVRKERSLSPYSRRLALTQAMNMGR